MHCQWQRYRSACATNTASVPAAASGGATHWQAAAGSLVPPGPGPGGGGGGPGTGSAAAP